MSDPTVSYVELCARIDADDIVKGLRNNDDLILVFILEVLDQAGSSDLEQELLLRIKERLGVVEPVPMPGSFIAGPQTGVEER